MDLIQSNGQPRYGRFKEAPSSINIDRYEYRTPAGKVLTGWRKKLKYKKFKFCGIQHEDYSIGIVIADIGWIGHGFVYVYDHKTGDLLEWHTNTVLGRNTVVDEQPQFSQSHFSKSPFQFEMEHANGVRYIKVTKHGDEQLKARIFCAGTEPLCLSSPNGINGWTYTQKSTTLAVEGFFINKKKQRVDFHDKSFAALDDTCGFLRPETAWFWLSISFWDKQGSRVGLNLASGVNESFGNENGLWVNGTLYPIADVLFERVSDDIWKITSLDQKLQLIAHTGWRRFENINLKLLSSHFSQWQSRISGTIEMESGEVIQLDQEYGLLEQHYSKW